jgi:hypothetical protein
MAEEQPLVEKWRDLFRLAEKIREIAPWNLMDETDVFGIRNPETEELGFVSVMGMQGMLFCIALYKGSKTLSTRPGYLPWYINGDEARFLIYALEQVIDIAHRFEEDEYLLDFDDDLYLMRVVPVKYGRRIQKWHGCWT